MLPLIAHTLSPSSTMPMCDTLENPITYLKSVCRMATNAPYTMPTVASTAKIPDQ